MSARRFQVGDTVRVAAYGLGDHAGVVTSIEPDTLGGFWLNAATAPYKDAFRAIVSTTFARLDGAHRPRFGYTVELIEAAAEIVPEVPTTAQVRRAVTASGWRDVNGEGFDAWLAAHDAETVRSALNTATPGAQAAAWAASCEALDAASATERLAALHRVMDATVDDLERAELVPDDYEYVPDTNVGEFRILTGNLQFRAGMTGSLDTPAAHFIVTTSDDDDPGIAMERTTTDLGQVRAWLMSWTVGAR